jgi:hypothetical protein
MDNILNMEYSLKTTLYLVELQAKEGLQARFIRYLETYNFCNGVEYKNEVLDYLSKYNIDFVSKIVNLHKKICNKVCDLWDNKLSHIPTDSINAEMKGIKGVFDYDIYFTTRKDSQFPFTEIESLCEITMAYLNMEIDTLKTADIGMKILGDGVINIILKIQCWDAKGIKMK